jgi:hypothetical protein
VHHSLMQRDLIVAARVLTTPKYELRGFPDLRFAFPLAGQTVIGQDDIMHEFKIAVARSGEDRGSQIFGRDELVFHERHAELGPAGPRIGGRQVSWSGKARRGPVDAGCRGMKRQWASGSTRGRSAGPPT